MPATIIEAPDDESTETRNVEAENENKVADTSTSQKEEENADVASAETQEEAQTEDETVELAGKKYSAAQIKKWEEDYTNDSKWKTENQRAAEELKRERERIARESQETAQLRLIKPLIEQRPEILQQLFQPKAERNFDAELDALYANKPDQFADPQGFAQWERAKDGLQAERITAQTSKLYENQARAQVAYQHNKSLDDGAAEKYIKSGVLTADELYAMQNWIVQNVNAPGGLYPKDVYDHAFKILHEDKWLRTKNLDASNRAIAPLVKAKNDALSHGAKPPVSPESEDPATSEFRDHLRARRGKNYMKLPA